MYEFQWDTETGGYLLTTTQGGVVGREVRPVYYKELDLLGFNEYWEYPKDDSKPLMWAVTNEYFYRGEKVAKILGGSLYTAPILTDVVGNLKLDFANIELMVEKNKVIMEALTNDTLKIIYERYQEFKKNNAGFFYVGFSGGKDSIVALDLTQRAVPHDELRVVFGDTDMELQDTYYTVNKYKKLLPDVEFIVSKARLSADESWKLFGPPSRTLRWCCSVHKTAPSIQKIIDDFQSTNTVACVGVRAEESFRRSQYEELGVGEKHSSQTNFMPILSWNTAELYLYIYFNNLFLNPAYKKGIARVGCILCPMSGSKYEYLVNTIYPDEVKKYIDLIKDSSSKSFDDDNDFHNYLDKGGWKARKNGMDLINSYDKIVEISKANGVEFVITDFNNSFFQWIKTIGYLNTISSCRYSVLCDNGKAVEFEIKRNLNIAHIFVYLNAVRENSNFYKNFKNILKKTAFCVRCGACQVECNSLALTMKDKIAIDGKRCKHCLKCHITDNGCYMAKSLKTYGGNSMSSKGLCIYNHFGFRKEWLDIFLNLGPNFWGNPKMGKPMIDGFKKWLKEAELLNQNNEGTNLTDLLHILGTDSSLSWGLIYIGLANNSALIKWYVNNFELQTTYNNDDILNLLDVDISASSKSSAILSLKETMSKSPLGDIYGAGVSEKKGKTLLNITRTSWRDPDPLIILYSLYKFAEKCEGYYSFTLSDLMDDSIEREGMSPSRIFGIDRPTLEKVINGLSINHSDFINSAFTHDLENISLCADKKSLDVLKLF